MSLSLSDATAAGIIAAQITTTTSIIDGLSNAAVNNFLVSKAYGINPTTGGEASLFITPLDAAGSATVLKTLLTVFQAQLAALNTQLAAIGQHAA